MVLDILFSLTVVLCGFLAIRLCLEKADAKFWKGLYDNAWENNNEAWEVVSKHKSRERNDQLILDALNEQLAQARKDRDHNYNEGAIAQRELMALRSAMQQAVNASAVRLKEGFHAC